MAAGTGTSSSARPERVARAFHARALMDAARSSQPRPIAESLRPAKPKAKAKPQTRGRRDPAKAWAKRARARPARPDVDTCSTALASRCMASRSSQRVHDPTSELILTMLSAEQRRHQRREGVRRRCAATIRRTPSRSRSPRSKLNRPGWGGVGIDQLAPPTGRPWRTRHCDELIDAIRPGGLAPQKAPRIQAVAAQDLRGTRRLLARRSSTACPPSRRARG